MILVDLGDIKVDPTPPVVKNGMITHEKGVSNWPDCTISKVAIKTFYDANFKNSGRSLE